MIITEHNPENNIQRQSQAIATQYRAWYREVLHENWADGSDILDRYKKTELLPGNKALFYIQKSKAVIYTHVEYSLKRVFVRFVGPVEDFEKYLKRTVA